MSMFLRCAVLASSASHCQSLMMLCLGVVLQFTAAGMISSTCFFVGKGVVVGLSALHW